MSFIEEMRIAHIPSGINKGTIIREALKELNPRPPPSATALVSDTKGVKQGCCYCDKDQLIAMWCLKSMLVNKYFVRVADASRAYARVILVETVEPPIVCRKCNGRQHTSI